MAELQQDREPEIITVALDPQAWIRVTVLVSFALTVVFILVFLLSNGGREIFERRVTLRTYISDGSGLERKAIVELDGIKIGSVQSVELSHSNEPTRVVRVNLAVNQKFLASIPVDSLTEVTQDNPLGDQFLNIRRGTASESVKAGDELLTKPPSKDFNPADLIATMQQVLNQANSILDAIDDPQTQIGQLVLGEELYDKLLSEFVGFQTGVHKLGNPKSPAGQAIFGTDLYDQLRAPLQDIDKQLAAIKSGEGQYGHLLASTEQYDKLRAQVGDFRQSVAQLKTNKFLTSDEMYVSLLASVKKLDTVIKTLSSSPYFDSAQLYESLSGSSRKTARFLKEFRENPQKFLRIKVF